MGPTCAAQTWKLLTLAAGTPRRAAVPQARMPSSHLARMRVVRRSAVGTAARVCAASAATHPMGWDASRTPRARTRGKRLSNAATTVPAPVVEATCRAQRNDAAVGASTIRSPPSTSVATANYQAAKNRANGPASLKAIMTAPSPHSSAAPNRAGNPATALLAPRGAGKSFPVASTSAGAFAGRQNAPMCASIACGHHSLWMKTTLPSPLRGATFPKCSERSFRAASCSSMRTS
mmetsp:Transcript_50292/g.155411  ORF Transcript_50292/g.155411 Transcript_50292/m.155411 type:complete len:234 (-) Transcript_50292:961-1662(-)